MLEKLKKYKVLLASKSPRRRELMEQLRIPFSTISTGGIDEKYPEDLPVRDIPQYLANLKGNAYMSRFSGNELVITADTLVILDDEVLGKPKDRDEAISMLQKLSGRTHKVVTGVSISTVDKRTTFSVSTEVTFAELTDADIEYYVDNYLPFDKAGAYGIQEWIGCVAVESIKGSYYNVMGLPVQRLYSELKAF
ncbi:MAG: septum formation protein Maf [Bacteroides sp.]|nr:septum formation protein Maf [Bacteroidales bacterium]MBD5301659.1 septum formation protein Maf [Bacteroides sp.]MBD5206451.1 septum formation protein Maf [Bacteroidales bacterium]MBD5224245.1 septum formation protein Maf [Bacteroidales bacterium]MBD5305454.1 septum formation protein Maf [Bacteroides sp.]